MSKVLSLTDKQVVYLKYSIEYSQSLQPSVDAEVILAKLVDKPKGGPVKSAEVNPF